LLHWQFSEHIVSLDDQPKLLANFPQRGIEHRLVFRISLAARKSDLSAVHTNRIAQNHDDVQLAVLRPINGNDTAASIIGGLMTPSPRQC
jgi:hypothetical protein